MLDAAPRGPVTLATPVAHAGDLPREADLVVIGGGVAGVTAAHYAAKAGFRVVLCEKGRIAGEQSSRNWGWIRQQGRDPDEIPIAMEAVRNWHALQAETNEDLGLRQTGTLYLARDTGAEARYEAWLVHARARGLDSRPLTRADLAEMLPEARGGWRAALWTASDARAEPWVAVPALARLAARSGVTIREACAVRALDVEAGRVAGVVTERGRIRAPAAVVAGGAWSSMLLRRHGIDIPQLSVRATVGQTEPLPEIFDGQGVDGDFAFRRRQDGGYSLAPAMRHDFFVGPEALRHMAAFWPVYRTDILSTGLRPAGPRGYPDAWRTRRVWGEDEESPFERMRVLDAAPAPRHLKQMVAAFEAAFPALGPVRLRHAWAGMIDTLPDTVPVLDRAESLPGLVILTGLSGHGFGIGPGAGRIAADLALGRAPGHDLTRFRLARFHDGSRPAAHPHL